MPCARGMRACRALCRHREMVTEYRWERAAQEERCENMTGFSVSEREREEVRAFFGDDSAARMGYSEKPLTFKDWLMDRRSKYVEP